MGRKRHLPSVGAGTDVRTKIKGEVVGTKPETVQEVARKMRELAAYRRLRKKKSIEFLENNLVGASSGF
jgi:hypothetical protein